MRKLNQVVRPRPVPCPIPRPPTPPHSVHVENLKSQLLNSSKHSLVSSHSSSVIMKSNSSSSSSTSNNPFKDVKITSSSRNSSQTIVDVHSLPSDDDGSCNISTSSNSSVESAIEPNEDFPPPPEEFLEDIRAVRKQEEIEGPIPSPTVPNQRMLHVFDLTSDHFTQSNVLSQRQRSSLCYNGNGSLNSSITEATESASSWSPSVSPVPSPLPSPSHSSLDSTSTPNFIIGNNQLRSVLHESAFPSSPSSTSSCFQFPPPTSSHLIRHTTNSRIETNQLINTPQVHHLHPRRSSKGIVIALTGVTLAPLSTSCEKESIYQKLPSHRASNPPASSMYGTLPRSGSGSGVNTGGMKPPDYNTAMQRLSLAKNISMNANAVKVSQQSGMKQGALVGGQQPQVHRQQLIAAVNPQIQVQQREQSVSHQRMELIPGSSSPTISDSSLTTTTKTTSSFPPTSIHQSFSSCGDSGLTSSSGNGDSFPSTAPSVRDSQFQATQKDNHQNRQEIQSPPSCLKSKSQTSPSHDSNHGSLSQSSRRRNPPHLPETSAPSPTCSISSSSTRKIGNNCIKSKDSPSKGKKRVSFSDQVELVGLEEEYLPNPLLERVLGKAFLANNNISN